MGLFEIMLCKGGIDGSPTCLPPITNDGDTVNGFLTEEKVNEIIEITADFKNILIITSLDYNFLFTV